MPRPICPPCRLFATASFVALAAFLQLAGPAEMRADDQANPAEIAFFENKVRPLLVEHCYECHGEQAQESELRVDSYIGLMRGGAAGASVVPGNPDQSLLLTAVTYNDPTLQMPPDGKLSDTQIADLRRWIEIGAPHPNASGELPAVRQSFDLEAARQFWAFQPLKASTSQAVASDAASDSPAIDSRTDSNSWNHHPIDNLIHAKQVEAGLTPLGPADRTTLLRRATFDLHGLPPTPAEIAAFLNDPSPQAFEHVIDRLLNSPRYGERWGRHWLDVVRYADSNGLDENIAHGNAWRYRDYVIAAFNQDLPYDQFIIEQLAGDLLNQAEQGASTEQSSVSTADDTTTQYRRLIATGFLSLGPKVLAEVDEQKMEMDIVDEQVSTFGTAFMGLTLGCARCHDHKFDPILMRDYYALAGIFKSTHTMDSFTKIAKWHEHEIPTEVELQARQQHAEQLAALRSEIDQFIQQAKDELAASLETGQPLPEDAEARFPDATKEQLKKLREQLQSKEKSVPELSTAMGVKEGKVIDTAIHVRGSHLTLGESVPRGVPTVLAATSAPVFNDQQSGRLELARWLVNENHALTSRVIANRVWRWHFGRGLVATVDNFGELGTRPSHPELLDWLAQSLIDSGWSLKSLHREIMLSKTYQLSSYNDPELAAIDPENRFYWRADVRRLEAEAVRDSLLAVSGTLDPTMGGSLLHVANRQFLFDHTSKDETNYDSRKRSVYLPVIRNHLYDVFMLFDYADASVPNGDRPSSTVATQSLFMLNSQLAIDVAEALAEKIVQVDPDERGRQLYLTVFGREPSDNELEMLSDFLRDASELTDGDIGDVAKSAWVALCQTLLSSNEFLYVR